MVATVTRATAQLSVRALFAGQLFGGIKCGVAVPLELANCWQLTTAFLIILARRLLTENATNRTATAMLVAQSTLRLIRSLTHPHKRPLIIECHTEPCGTLIDAISTGAETRRC